MQGRHSAAFALALLLAATAPATAEDGEPIFSAGDHCVAYRTVKNMWFGSEVVVVGRSCEVDAKLVLAADQAGAHVVVSVPIKSLHSGNMLRNGTVADLLGIERQPDLRFTSDVIDADALRSRLASGRFSLPGTLSIGEKPYPVEFPLELVRVDGRRSVTGRLDTTFAAFDIVVPTVMGGFIAKPHEEVALVIHLDAARVDGLEAWLAAEGLE
jgi:polyisoprenoid-binding protein YceI